MLYLNFSKKKQNKLLQLIFQSQYEHYQKYLEKTTIYLNVEKNIF